MMDSPALDQGAEDSSDERPEKGRVRPGFRRYLVWRLATAAIIVLLVLTLDFYVSQVVPGDPTRLLIPGGCSTPANCALRNQLIQQWGLDRPLSDRYWTFLANILQGNLGTSMTMYPGTPVAEVIAARLPVTLALVGAGFLVALVLGSVIGRFPRRRRGGILEGIVDGLLTLPVSISGFALALSLVYVLGVYVPLFPVHGIYSIGYETRDPLAQVADLAWHLFLPAVALLLGVLGLVVWIVRDYPLRPNPLAQVSEAPADGGTSTRPRWARIRAAAPPVLAAVPPLWGWTVGTTLAVDAVFDLQGLGQLFWAAVLGLDYWLLGGVLIVLSLVLILPGLVVSDVAHRWLIASWERHDGLDVDRFRVRANDLRVGPKRILHQPLGLAGFVLAAVLVAMTLAAPIVAGPYPTPLTSSAPLQPPSANHPFGTDAFGRDVLALTVYGGQSGLVVAILAFALTLIAELGVVACVGFLGERGNLIAGPILDLFLVLPLPFAFLVVIVSSPLPLIVFVGLVAAPIPARCLQLDLLEISSPRTSLGTGRVSMLGRGARTLDLIWGAGPLLLANAFLGVALGLVVWGSLGFFKFSIRAAASWGDMLNTAYVGIGPLTGAWWTFVPPLVCLSASVLAAIFLNRACKAIGLRPAHTEDLPPASPIVSPEPIAPPPH